MISESLYLLLDFDGTLAPIVNDPAKAKMRIATSQLLLELSSLCNTGIISGRSLDDLKARLEIPSTNLFLSGTHGLESPFSSIDDFSPYLEFFLKLEEKIKAAYPYLLIEKKAVGFTIHLRRVRNSKKIEESLINDYLQYPELKVIKGKKVLNILPNRPHSKGWIVEKLLSQNLSKTFIYVGDDITDESVFQIMHPQLINIRVTSKKSSFAPYYMTNQKEIDLFLSKLIEHIRGEHA